MLTTHIGLGARQKAGPGTNGTQNTWTVSSTQKDSEKFQILNSEKCALSSLSVMGRRCCWVYSTHHRAYIGKLSVHTQTSKMHWLTWGLVLQVHISSHGLHSSQLQAATCNMSLWLISYELGQFIHITCFKTSQECELPWYHNFEHSFWSRSGWSGWQVDWLIVFQVDPFRNFPHVPILSSQAIFLPCSFAECPSGVAGWFQVAPHQNFMFCQNPKTILSPLKSFSYCFGSNICKTKQKNITLS